MVVIDKIVKLSGENNTPDNRKKLKNMMFMSTIPVPSDFFQVFYQTSPCLLKLAYFDLTI